MEKVMISAIFALVLVVLLTGIAPTITDNVATTSGAALENETATAKTIYGLYPFLFSLIGLFVIIGVVLVNVKRK